VWLLPLVVWRDIAPMKRFPDEGIETEHVEVAAAQLVVPR